MQNISVPLKGFAGLKAHFREDLIAGFSVSLIALPLCLGIAIASGMPPLAGLITAIIGGLFASRISGTFVTISGPAAGLIVLNLAATESMGGAGPDTNFAGYPHALGAIVVAGGIVAMFGFIKAGKIGDFFPSAAVHGMLAAIGVIIIIKQIFPALGVASPKGEILEIATEIPYAFTILNPYSTTVAVISLLILKGHTFLKIKVIKVIPAPMWVLIVTIPLAQLLGTENLKLVSMPHNILGEGGIQFPSFEKIGQGVFWSAVVGIALVSAIESLLSAKAVDSLDPYQRKSNLDGDLVAMGSGSSLAAMIGGLPMISEIVRSSANINSGAKTQWANFFHAGFLLFYLLVGIIVIEMIPMAALAAMLVFTGFKLASPQEFNKMFKIGLLELEIFVITLVAVLATDLVMGIVIGILFKYVVLIVRGVPLRELFTCKAVLSQKGDAAILKVSGSVIFSNYLSLKKKMDKALKNAKVLDLDLTDATIIDHTVMEHFEEYERNLKNEQKELHLVNIDSLNTVSDHPLAARDKNTKRTKAYTHLAERQMQWFDYASHHNYSYSSRTYQFEEWAFYTLTIRKKILAIENIINIPYKGLILSIADLITEEGAIITTEKQSYTTLKISGLETLPKFYMEKETAFDKMTEYFKGNDINFETHPSFSNKFILKTDGDEQLVRTFFNSELLSLLENEPEYLLVSNGLDLLIHKNTYLKHTSELDTLIQKSKEVIDLLEITNPVLVTNNSVNQS